MIQSRTFTPTCALTETRKLQHMYMLYVLVFLLAHSTAANVPLFEKCVLCSFKCTEFQYNASIVVYWFCLTLGIV